MGTFFFGLLKATPPFNFKRMQMSRVCMAAGMWWLRTSKSGHSIETFCSQQARKQPEAQLTRVIWWGCLPKEKREKTKTGAGKTWGPAKKCNKQDSNSFVNTWARRARRSQNTNQKINGLPWRQRWKIELARRDRERERERGIAIGRGG